MKVWFPRETSGIHIAQSRCAHFDEFVCLKAPSLLGQNMHVCEEGGRGGTDRAAAGGEGLTGRKILTRPRAPRSGILSYNAGEGCRSGYSAFSIASALEASTWPGWASTLSAFTTPLSTSIE